MRFGAPAARVRLAGFERAAPVEADVTVTPGEGKRVRLNGALLASPEELRGRLSALVFVPDRVAVVKGGPFVRRAYFDRMLGRLFPTRAALPAEYARALAQRNEALRRLSAGRSTREAVSPWTETLAERGSELESARSALVALLGERFRERCRSLGLDDATLAYAERPLSAAMLEARLDRDVARGATGLGPHLRDIEISAGGRELRSFGSQGEQRVAVLALVLAEADVTAGRLGAAPLLLLDDVLSELDPDRARALLATLPGGQTVVTATTRAALPAGAGEPALALHVRPGAVEPA